MNETPYYHRICFPAAIGNCQECKKALNGTEYAPPEDLKDKISKGHISYVRVGPKGNALVCKECALQYPELKEKLD